VRTVEATLNFLGVMEERPVFSPTVPGGTNLVLEPHTVRITDARSLREPPSLDRDGFALLTHRSAVRNYRGLRRREQQYLDEIAELIRYASGAQEVRASPRPVTRYVDRRDTRRSAGTAPAVRFVHTDYTDTSAREHFLGQVIDPNEALRRYRRIVIYQAWRCLSQPPQDVPLTITDTHSVSHEDTVTAQTVVDGDCGQAQLLEYTMCRYNLRQRWYYFSRMVPQELLVFKGHDLQATTPARVFHSAFDDPSVPPGTAPRASIEARAFAFFES
jgi:hypothetical protein